MKGQLPTDVEATLLPDALIEGHQFKVLQAKQCLSNHAHQAELITQKEASHSQANHIKTRAEVLENSQPIIVSEIDQLKASRAVLMKQLRSVTHALADKMKRLEQLPIAVPRMKEDMKAPVREAIRRHKSIKPIPGLADDDRKELSEVHQIHVRAIDAI